MKNIETNLIKFPIDNMDQILYNLNMSVRQIKKSYISCTGYFASYKNHKQMMFESVLERDFFMILEFDKRVIKYEAQPLTIKYEYTDGSIRKYTPDVLVTYTSGLQRLYEVKYQNELINNIELKEKIQLLKNHIYEENKLEFELFTDEELGNPYMDNLKFLYFYAFMKEDSNMLNKINNILNNIEKTTIKDLLKKISNNRSEHLLILPHIWKYIFLHTDRVLNLYDKLTMNTIIEKKIC